MMTKFYSIISSVSFFLLVVTASKCARKPGGECLSQEDAQQVADNYSNLISEYTDAIVKAGYTENYTQNSDSTALLINSGCKGPVKVSLGH